MSLVSTSIRPLFFVFTRSTVNGVKRAFSSGRRLIGLLVFAAYYLQFAFRSSGRPSPFDNQDLGQKFAFPPMATVDAAVFTIFGALSVLFMASVMNTRSSFRQADVDVLFPTPVSMRAVLVFRLVREYITTVFFPLFLAVFGGRNLFAGVKYVFANYPDESGIVGRSASIAWPLMALAWVSLSYGVTMFVNRSDLQSDRNKKIIGWTVGSVIVFIAAFIGISMKINPTLDTFVDTVRSPLVRLALLPASAATAMVTGPLQHNYALLAVGAGGLVAISIFGVWLAMTQVGYLYDQAAAKGFGASEMRALQRSGDFYSMRAEQARQGKVRVGKLTSWIGGWRMQGARSLMWKEILLQLRGGTAQLIMFGVLTVFMSWMPIWAAGNKLKQVGELYLIMQACSAFVIGFGGSQMAFIEMLKRVDLNKPLPFSPTQMTFWETAARIIPAFVIAVPTAIGSCLIQPGIWKFAIASMIMMPITTLVINSVTLLVTVLFPDYEDITQRNFRGLMQMLGVMIGILPGIGIAVVCMAFKVSPLLMAIPVVAIDLGLSVLFCFMAGRMYANFNPSE